MPGKRFRWLILGAAMALALSDCASAAPPWAKLVLFKHLEADPNEMYSISDANGPWMIMAATFSGEGAEDQARNLIYELRKDYKLPAYSYNKKFEYSKPVRGKGLNPQGEAPLMRYRRGEDVVEIAVVVGDYPTVDDPEAQRVLKKLKLARPKSLEVKPEETKQALAGYRMLQMQAKKVLFPKTSDTSRGPMGSAFVITNPLLPHEYFVPKGVDKLVLEMNRGVPHGLLDCPEPYTVKVATFTGHAIILDKKVEEAMQRGQLPKSYLEEAASHAHNLTEMLRLKGYEAYEFHDRNSSIVTVGSFNSVGKRRPDGKIEINPELHATMRTFGVETKVEAGKPAQVGQPKKLSDIVGKQLAGRTKGMPDIPFDVQPMPVEVPRMSLSNTYDRTSGLR